MAGEAFDEIWDFYTLGGRITGLTGDKDKFRELVGLTSETGAMKGNARPSTHVRRKATTMYFFLPGDNPCPAPKINIYPANFAVNGESIIRGRKHFSSYFLVFGRLGHKDFFPD